MNGSKTSAGGESADFPINMSAVLVAGIILVAAATSAGAQGSAVANMSSASGSFEEAHSFPAIGLPAIDMNEPREVILSKLCSEPFTSTVAAAQNFFRASSASIPDGLVATVVTLEGGALVVEWATTGRKLAMFFEVNPSDSSWVLASKQLGVDSGPMADIDLARLLKSLA